MKKLKPFILIFALIIFSFPAVSQTESSGDLFTKGTQFYTQKEYKKAQELLTQSLDKDPGNPSTLTNLALAEFQLNNKLVAIGLLRKALAIEPSFAVAQSGLKFILSQVSIKEVPHQNEVFEFIRTHFLVPYSINSLLVLLALSLFSTGWVWLSFAGRRKRALNEEKSPPPIPVIGGFLGLVLVIFTGLASLKFYDSTILRGTIIQERVSLQTAPGENQVVILDLYGGMEVIARQVQGDWIQVTYPGSLTGWIKKSSLLMTR
jgi:tetratricopeptide (TPR) repeat protein